MFMGGIVRSVEADGLFVVQTNPPFNITDIAPEERASRADEIAQVSARVASEDVDYLIRMGISRDLLSEIMYARPPDRSTRRCLTRAELVRYRLVND
jgi:hypothetical protein